MNLVKHWYPAINTSKAHLLIWKAKHLSMGGRLTLIRSVLDSLSVNFFLLFKALEKVIEELENLHRKFRWVEITTI